MSDYALTALAKTDIFDIWSYIAEQNENAANRVRTLRTWFEELDSDPRYHASTAFPNARGMALSRDGVDYILQHAVERSVKACPSLANKHVTPHLIRHTSGMHLLQAGVGITVIALWLGHESTQTTHGYIEADLALKRFSRSEVVGAGFRFGFSIRVVRFRETPARARTHQSLSSGFRCCSSRRPLLLLNPNRRRLSEVYSDYYTSWPCNDDHHGFFISSIAKRCGTFFAA
jgi:plasmid stabilization system protein ParE